MYSGSGGYFCGDCLRKSFQKQNHVSTFLFTIDCSSPITSLPSDVSKNMGITIENIGFKTHSEEYALQ
jgi:hypothetical protein